MAAMLQAPEKVPTHQRRAGFGIAEWSGAMSRDEPSRVIVSGNRIRKARLVIDRLAVEDDPFRFSNTPIERIGIDRVVPNAWHESVEQRVEPLRRGFIARIPRRLTPID